MGLNIKNPEAHRLARELAELTGESMATAVTEALRERLARARKKGLAERLMKIGEKCVAQIAKTDRPMMDVEDLYDPETGLPR